jgi:uncharacterized protein DUF1206
VRGIEAGEQPALRRARPEALTRGVAAGMHVASRRLVRGARRAARSAPVQALARAGYVAKATLYGLVGVLALRSALGLRGGRTLDGKAALALLAYDPSGQWVVAPFAIALAGLGLFFVLDGVAGTARASLAPLTPLAMIGRVGQAVGGLLYVALGAVGLRLALGEPAGPDGDALARAFAARVLAQPTGPAAAIVVGIGAVVVGVRQARFGWTRGFLSQLELARAAPGFRRGVAVVGAVGFVAQGTLFALMGISVVQAALAGDPREASGTGGALAALARAPHGTYLLLVFAAGLLAYALYAGIEAAARRFPGG